MKKLLTATLIFSFCAADAGLISSIKNVSVKAVTALDKQLAKSTSRNQATNGTVISDPTIRAELINALSSMYEEASSIRKSNKLKPKILYYASNLCVTLQKCINAPATTLSNISSIENYINQLQSRNVNVTNLNQHLTSLKTVVEKFNSSTVLISNNTINQAVQQELIITLNEMSATIAQIRSEHVTDVIILKETTSLQTTLQNCVSDPSTITTNVEKIKECIQNLQNQNIDVTILNKKLAVLNKKIPQLFNSASSIDFTKIPDTILSEFTISLNDLLQEILKIQNTYSTNSTLSSYSEQIYSLLQSCGQTFVVTSNHISATTRYIQWLSAQQIDITGLNGKFTAFQGKVTNLNKAIANANTVNTSNTANVTATSGVVQTTTNNAVNTSSAVNITAVSSATKISTNNAANTSGAVQTTTNNAVNTSSAATVKATSGTAKKSSKR